MNGLAVKLATALVLLAGLPALLGGCVGQVSEADEESESAAPVVMPASSTRSTASTASTLALPSSSATPRRHGVPVPHTDETAQDSEDEAALPSTVSGVPGSGASTSVAKSGTVVNIAAASTPTEGDPEPQPWNVDSHSNAR